MTLFYSFLKNTAPHQLIFLGKLSTIIIFKRCKFSVNLWKLCFVLQKVPKSFIACGGNTFPYNYIPQQTLKIKTFWKLKDKQEQRYYNSFK